MFTFDDFPSLKELLEAVAVGDEQAQQSLYKKFEPLFHRGVKQSLRLKGCANPDEHSPGVGNSSWRNTFRYIGELRNSDSFVAWANRIIEREINVHLARCIKQQAEVPLEGWYDQPASIASAEDVIINAELVDRTLAIAKTIHSKLPDILILRFVDGLRFDEIAPLVGESYGNVRTIYSRGLRKLRPALRDKATMARLRI